MCRSRTSGRVNPACRPERSEGPAPACRPERETVPEGLPGRTTATAVRGWGETATAVRGYTSTKYLDWHTAPRNARRSPGGDRLANSPPHSSGRECRSQYQVLVLPAYCSGPPRGRVLRCASEGPAPGTATAVRGTPVRSTGIGIPAPGMQG